MIPEERKKSLENLLLKEKKISFQELQQTLRISRSTLYRDLEKLEKEGLISIHKGLISCNLLAQPGPTAASFPDDYRQQEEIAMTAVQMVSEMDSIFLGEGLLCLLMARYIREQKHLKNITVVTNNFNAAVSLRGQIGHVYLIGGDLLQNAENYYTGGPRLESNLSSIFVSKAFAAVDGIDQQSGYTMHELSQLSMLLHLPDFSAETIFLIPSARFGYNSVHQLAPITYPDKIITDGKVAEQYRKIFSRLQKPELVLAEQPHIPA